MASGEKRNRANQELQPKCPHPRVGASEPAHAELPTPQSRSQPSRQGGTGSTGKKELEVGALALEKLPVRVESYSTPA